jgi:transcriptional regulator with XRE-family HTH domain
MEEDNDDATSFETDDPAMSRFNEEVGDRLRDARRRRGWSLLDVESVSDGEFKASVLGAYERGERSVSAGRLWRLAQLYDIHVASLLPGAERGDDDPDGVLVDVDAAGKMSPEQGELIERYLSAIQVMRKDTVGPTLAVRKSDLRVLNVLLEADSPAAAMKRLAERDG